MFATSGRLLRRYYNSYFINNMDIKKTLYLIGGPMGVGKTAVGQYLKHKLPNAVMLDGDWCWNADPFIVNAETKAMVMDNICYLINGFLHSSVYTNIVFSWVMDQQSIIDEIISHLDKTVCRVRIISLLANEETLRQRIMSDVQDGTRTVDVLQRSLDRLPGFQQIHSDKVFTDNKSIRQIADEILALYPGFPPL